MSSPHPVQASGNGRSRTAGLIVIGNEVLSAKVQDENTPVVLSKLAGAGIRVGEVALLADDVARIAAVVRDFAARFDLVVTTGGVGPTHDDCTWQAVAMALDRPLELHQALIDRVESRLGVPMTTEQRRMALLPAGTVLHAADGRWPLLQVANVFVLPGVPSLVAGRIDRLCEQFAMPRAELATVYLGVDEWDFVPAIDAVVAAHPDLEIGSYPVFDGADHRLRLTFEGHERHRVESAVHAIAGYAGQAKLVRVEWRNLTTTVVAQEPA